MPCRHKDKRRYVRQQCIRHDMKDAVSGSLSVETIEYTQGFEEPQNEWLDDYTKTVKSNSTVQSWDRSAYKPDKYNQKTENSNSNHSDIPEIKLVDSDTRYHHCEKHGLVRLPENSQSYIPQTNSNSRYSYYKGGPGVDFSEYLPKITELGKKLISIAMQYPRVTAVLLGMLFIWWISYQIDVWLSYMAYGLVRVFRPAAHWWNIYIEQFAIRLRSFAATSDDLVESFYCDFARSWCRKFDMMCEVRCSFMDKAIERIRAHP